MQGQAGGDGWMERFCADSAPAGDSWSAAALQLIITHLRELQDNPVPQRKAPDVS